MTYLLAASAPAHVSMIVGPLGRILRARGHEVVTIYGGKRRNTWSTTDMDWIGWYWHGGMTRTTMLSRAVAYALQIHRPDATIVTSARYHLEQELLAQAKPCVFYPSTYFLEASFKDGQRDSGPRMQYYDVGDQIWTIGQHLKDQLVAHGVTRPIVVVGSPVHEALELQGEMA